MSVDIELLISSIQERPPLWDQSNKKYMDRDVSINLWKEVAAECNTTDIIAKKKWKHLRDSFRSELKKEGKPKSGDAQGDSPCKTHWKWFENMEFLKGTLSSRAMEGNLKTDRSYFTHEEPHRETQSLDGEGLSCPQSPTNVSITSTASTSLSSSVGRKRKGIAAEDGERLNIEKEKLDLMKSMARKEEDKDTTYHYLMSLKDPINSLPMHSQMFVRYKIMEIVMKEIEKNRKPNTASLQSFNYTDYVLQPTSTPTISEDTSTLFSTFTDEET